MRDDARLLFSQRGTEQLLRDFPDETLLEGLRLLRAIRLLALRLNEAASSWLPDFGLTSTKFNYISLLFSRRDTGLTAGELGAAGRTTSGSVTTMIDSLEREHLVARHGHPTDGRRIVIKLTPKGKRVYLDCARVHNERVVAIVNALGKAKSSELLRLLVELGNVVHEISPESSPSQRSAAPPLETRETLMERRALGQKARARKQAR